MRHSQITGSLPIVDAGAAARFEATSLAIGTDAGDPLTASGGGVIDLDGIVSFNGPATFPMKGETDGLNVLPGAVLRGRTLSNTGNVTVRTDGVIGHIDIDLENEGMFTFVKSAGLHPVDDGGLYRFQNKRGGTIVHEGAGTSPFGVQYVLESAGDFLVKEGTLELDGKTTLSGVKIDVRAEAALKFSGEDPLKITARSRSKAPARLCWMEWK